MFQSSRFPLLNSACILLLLLSTVPAHSQNILTSTAAQKVAAQFDAPAENSLKCSVYKRKPELDFAFRFEIGYMISCGLGFFRGVKTNVVAYVRVTPRDKTPVIFAEDYHLPQITRGMTGGVAPEKLKQALTMSGAIGVGEGDYRIEILVIDSRDRSCRKRWDVRVARHRSQRDVHLEIAPLTAEPLARATTWVGPEARGHGLHLTVLLDAAPISPYSSTLHAWDRAFLLESLYSLLRQIPTSRSM